jgi:glycosyltransferase involved in cell wall biosynthesis
MPPRISVTIPAYNEETTLAEVVSEAALAAGRIVEDYEVLIVDDGSTDLTGKTADLLSEQDCRIRVVHHQRNRGFSGAIQSCVENAAGDYVFLGPADGQGRYEDLARFWELRDRQDLIFSERAEREDGIHRKLASAVFYTFFRSLFGIHLPQFSATFLFRRDAIPELPVAVRPDASNFLLVVYLMAVWEGRRIGFVTSVCRPRRGGEAKGSSVTNTIRTMTEDLALWWQLRIRHGRHVRGLADRSQPSAAPDVQRVPPPVERGGTR